MTNDLIPLENPQPSALFAPGGLETILTRIEADARALVPDIGTVKGRSAIASLAAKVAKAKTYLDGLGKDYTADLKRQTGAVDAERKAMRDRLDALKAEVRKPLDDWEQEETDRVDSIRQRIAMLQYLPMDGLPSDRYAADIAALDAIAVDDSFAEFRGEAQAAKEACLYRLTVARDAALHREAEAARISAEAEAARAKVQDEREERIAREAAERATRDALERAEREKVAAAKAQAEAVERERQAKIQAERAQADAERKVLETQARAKAAAEQADRDRLSAIAAERARADREQAEKVAADKRRAADKENRERVHAEIADDIFNALSDDKYDSRQGQYWNCIVKAIVDGRIRHLTITY